MSSVRRVIPLILGWEHVPSALSLDGDESGEYLVEPVPALLLDTDDGWAMLDTGLNAALIRDPHLRRRFHGRGDVRPILPEGGEPVVDALAQWGVTIGDVTRIYLSHLHDDHAGSLRLFEAKVPVWVHRREYAFAMGWPEPERQGMFRIDYDDPETDWRFIDGDAELAPGIFAFETPGHTPGHLSFVIETQEGEGWVFACDAGDLAENFEGEISPGGLIESTPERGLASVMRVKEIAAARGFPIVPGHDPVVWPELVRAAGGTPPESPVDARS